MFNFDMIDQNNKKEFYETLKQYIEGLMTDERDLIANLANVSSLMFNMMADVNWSGFYLYKEEQLVLGPFHGKPACIRIPIGRGVCGNAAKDLETQLVRDVHQYPGHIACDGDTNSEIVIPMVSEGSLIGVLDIDSPILNRFNDEDQGYLEDIVRFIVKGSNV